MIDAETVDRAVLLLSTAVGEAVEDEHVAMISPPRGGHAAALAHAGQLEQLGRDMATLAAAISVLLRRREADEPA